MKLRLLRRIQEAPNVESFYFSKPTELTYKSGQYGKVYLPHSDVDERGDTRLLSLASSPTENFVLFGLKFYKYGSSFKAAFKKLYEGDEITMDQPMGTFTLPEDKNKKLLFIAGGIGITPYRSLLKYLIDKDQNRDVVLLYAANSEGEFIYREVIDEAEIERYYATDFLNANKIAETVNDFDERLIYLSGPQPMIETLYEGLQSNSIAREQIQLDYFPGYESL